MENLDLESLKHMLLEHELLIDITFGKDYDYHIITRTSDDKILYVFVCKEEERLKTIMNIISVNVSCEWLKDFLKNDGSSVLQNHIMITSMIKKFKGKPLLQEIKIMMMKNFNWAIYD